LAQLKIALLPSLPAALGWSWVLGAALLLWSGCSLLQPLQQFSLGDLGHFAYRRSNGNQGGIVVGVPHGRAEPKAVEYGERISDAIGAGLVVGYDFNAKRIPVSQPLVHQSPVGWPAGGARRGSVYPEFTKLLQETVSGPMQFYVGVRVADNRSEVPRIEVAAGGFSFEELLALKASYRRLRDESLGGWPAVPKVDVAIHPLDDISWTSYGVRNYGVLLLAERGLVIRLPQALAAGDNFAAYDDVVTAWVRHALNLAQGRAGTHLPSFVSRQMTYGRIDAIAARKESRGIVLAAPHGSFDWYTGELVEELSYRTQLPAVITRGFTPTECGGWRINVNRPTERRYPTQGVGRKTERAQAVFDDYSRTVFEVGRGALDLYIERHQSGALGHIDVATVGVTSEAARAIKNAFRQIRDRVLQANPGIGKVELLIEPIDAIEIGAWAAKDQGMLKLAQTSLHFELPAHNIMHHDRTRRIYTAILAELVDKIVRGGDGLLPLR